MRYLTVSFGYADLLVCADCGSPCPSLAADYKDLSGSRVVADFRDADCTRGLDRQMVKMGEGNQGKRNKKSLIKRPLRAPHPQDRVYIFKH